MLDRARLGSCGAGSSAFTTRPVTAAILSQRRQRVFAGCLRLSREQVPILVAADRAGATLSHTLPALNADNMKQVLEPAVARDALLVSGANRCYPPVAAALDIPHESINGSAGERVRGALHIQTVKTGIPSRART